ncbi:MAG: hypothetical protein FJW40_00795 [Acidobacteria bacterium]|nr:hypothetical protein [Acidobacteriota bacterium]
MRRRRNGTSLLESALLVPLILLLLLGAIEFARLTITYYTLQKALYGMARYLGVQQAVNFCDDTDATVTAAKNLAVFGNSGGTGDPILPNLATDQIAIRIETVDTENEELTDCDCSSSGCDTTQGGRAPEFIAVSVTDGYPVTLRIPLLPTDPVILRPQVRVPFGGT